MRYVDLFVKRFKDRKIASFKKKKKSHFSKELFGALISMSKHVYTDVAIITTKGVQFYSRLNDLYLHSYLLMPIAPSGA